MDMGELVVMDVYGKKKMTMQQIGTVSLFLCTVNLAEKNFFVRG